MYFTTPHPTYPPLQAKGRGVKGSKFYLIKPYHEYNNLASIFEEILIFTATSKIKPSRVHKPSKYFGDNLNFIFDDEYPEV